LEVSFPLVREVAESFFHHAGLIVLPVLVVVAPWNRSRLMQKKKTAKGVTIVEYAIMLALIAIAIAAATPNITSAVTAVFGRASSVMK
jgi:Flp pilus assembly pilin Flp